MRWIQEWPTLRGNSDLLVMEDDLVSMYSLSGRVGLRAPLLYLVLFFRNSTIHSTASYPLFRQLVYIT